MENLFDTALSNPIYLAILAIIFILLLYAIIKKIIKLVISFGIILVVYVLYLNYTGQEVPKTVEDLKKSVTGNMDKAKEVASKSIENAKESTRKVVEEKAKEKIDEILSN
tara:strand:- start:1007 stop:1336 length:330 start_codon:yes stop_codon:yes gene_type:complete